MWNYVLKHIQIPSVGYLEVLAIIKHFYQIRSNHCYKCYIPGCIIIQDGLHGISRNLFYVLFLFFEKMSFCFNREHTLFGVFTSIYVTDLFWHLTWICLFLYQKYNSTTPYSHPLLKCLNGWHIQVNSYCPIRHRLCTTHKELKYDTNIAKYF